MVLIVSLLTVVFTREWLFILLTLIQENINAAYSSSPTADDKMHENAGKASAGPVCMSYCDFGGLYTYIYVCILSRLTHYFYFYFYFYFQ